MNTINRIAQYLYDLRNSDEGASMVEYGILVALIAVAVIGAVTLVGDELNLFFGDVQTELNGARPVGG